MESYVLRKFVYVNNYFKDCTPIVFQDIDVSCFSSNAWLAGFFDNFFLKNCQKTLNVNNILYACFTKFPLLSWKYHLMVPWLEAVYLLTLQQKNTYIVMNTILKRITRLQIIKPVKEYVLMCSKENTDFSVVLPADEETKFEKALDFLLIYFRFADLHWLPCKFLNINFFNWNHLERYFYQFEIELGDKFYVKW